MQLRNFRGAMSDLDMALSVDSTSLPLLRQRAEARANLSDFTGSLADLRKVPPDSLSASELRERADLSYSQGDDSLALADYGRLVARGSVADGQLGRARVLEQLGRKTEAIAAYRAAIPTITNSTQRVLAEAALRKLAPKVELPVAIVPQVSLFLQSRDDSEIAGIINKTLSKYGLKLAPRGRALYTERDSLGASALVRYYFAEDADLAKRTLLAVSEALDVSGSYRKADVFYETTPSLRNKPQRGEIDITLPPTFRPSKR